MKLINYLKAHSGLNLISDSRVADSKSLFVAIKGSSHDGHDFLTKAYLQGCRHFIVEDLNSLKNYNDIEVLVVKCTSKAWAEAWKLKTQNPALDIPIFGVTGTNGKTSISLMIEHILNFCNTPCGVMGTIDHHLKFSGASKTWPTSLTTPSADVLFPRILEMKSLGAKALAMEISSHALYQNRAEGLDLDVAIFSNLSEDHLDYHKDLESYFKSKVLLFESLLKNSSKEKKTSILNYSDSLIRTYSPKFGRLELLLATTNYIELTKDEKTLSLIKATISKNLNCKLNVLKIVKHDLSGLEFEIYFDTFKNGFFDLKPEVLTFRLPVIGYFQAMNWAQAILACKSQGLMTTKLIESSASFIGVPGRLQKVLTTKSKSVFIDYAHTPDALASSLKSLKDVCKGRLIVVFGCGGDRDRAKRPNMAKAAHNFADVQIITNDNPRTENPEQILADILKGFSSEGLSQTSQTYKIELDRKKAIQLGLSFLKTQDDVLLIAGKGHETYQILKDQIIDFNDYQVAFELIESKEE